MRKCTCFSDALQKLVNNIMGFDKKKSLRKPKNRQTKSILVFDDKARKDYLTGFKKRKDARRKRAKEEAEKMIKEEKRNLKRKRMEFLDKKVKHQYIPPDLEELAKQHVTELPDHTVTITDITEVDLAGQGGVRLGINKFHDSDEEKPDVKDADAKGEETEENKTKKLPTKKKEHILKVMGEKIKKREKVLKVKHKKRRKTLSKQQKYQRKHSTKNSSFGGHR